MRAMTTAMLVFTLIAGCADQPSLMTAAEVTPDEAIMKDYRQWRTKNYPQDKIGQITVELTSSTSTALNHVAGTVVLNHYTILETGGAWNATWYRTTGDFLPASRNSNKQRFFDSGFYMPECGGPHVVALTRASSFMLTKVPVVAIDEQLTSVMCVAPMEKITKTRFYVIRERMEEILVLETGFVKSDNEKTHMLETVYYPNGCPSDDDCSYLTVWSFDSTKSSPSVINHSWDEKKSRLLPYYKGRAQGSETNKQ